MIRLTMRATAAVFLLASASLLSSCSSELQNNAVKLKSDIQTTTAKAVNDTTKKIQQGKALIDSANDTLKKAEEFNK